MEQPSCLDRYLVVVQHVLSQTRNVNLLNILFPVYFCYIHSEFDLLIVRHLCQQFLHVARVKPA